MARNTYFAVLLFPGGGFAATPLPLCRCCGEPAVSIKAEDNKGNLVILTRDKEAVVYRPLPPEFMKAPALPEREKVEA